MKRSTYVSAPLLASAALAFTAGCRQPEMKRCVDEHNVVVDDSLCGPDQQNNNYVHPLGFYHFYYGGYGGYGLGSTASGGGFVPLSGHSYASSSTARGGFGSSHAGGGGDS